MLEPEDALGARYLGLLVLNIGKLRSRGLQICSVSWLDIELWMFLRQGAFLLSKKTQQRKVHTASISIQTSLALPYIHVGVLHRQCSSFLLGNCGSAVCPLVFFQTVFHAPLGCAACLSSAQLLLHRSPYYAAAWSLKFLPYPESFPLMYFLHNCNLECQVSVISRFQVHRSVHAASQFQDINSYDCHNSVFTLDLHVGKL